MQALVGALMGFGVLASCTFAWQALGKLSTEPRRSVPWNGWVVASLFVIYLFTQVLATVGAVAVRTAMLGEAQTLRGYFEALGREIRGLSEPPEAKPEEKPKAKAEEKAEEKAEAKPEEKPEAKPVEEDLAAKKLRAARFATLMLGMQAAGVVTLLIGYFLLRSCGATLSDLGLSWSHIGQDVRSGMLGFLALAPPTYFLQAILRLASPQDVKAHDVEKILSSLASLSGWELAWTFGAIGLAVAVMAPLVEEFLFRVVLQGWCERWWERRQANRQRGTATPDVAPAVMPTTDLIDPSNPYSAGAALAPVPGEVPASSNSEVEAIEPEGAPIQWIPIALASLLFAAAHLTQWPDPVPLFCFSMGLGYLYQRTHRLLPSVITHACLNGFSLAMLWLAVMTAHLDK